MLLIDGSYGEGGGQVLRTCLSLSVVLNKPFRIFNIRKNRPKPGLQPQHLACVKACAEISKAEVSGAELNSTEIVFIPKKKPAKLIYTFNIKTAGSTSLLFQTLLYPLALSEGGELILKGGTHVPFSPSFHYIKYVFLPFVEVLGLKAEVQLEKAGFYPKGGGKIRVSILPWNKFILPDMGKEFLPENIYIHSMVSEDLPHHILERQMNSAKKKLLEKNLEPSDEIFERVKSDSSGTMVFVYAVDKDKVKRAGFSELGKKGYPAEKVGENAVYKFLEFIKTKAQFEEHLADQILIPLSFVLINSIEKGFSFTICKITKHLLTQAWLIPQFLEKIAIKISGKEGEPGEVEIERK
ncbi:MAG: RNA 3'-phosphate cyclase [Thermodesulfobacterium geofontis]|uniref:RNA 3'-terminal phosphate cyclase n=1 Tax=Thermodesulfobacterium geofontis TaxID=1295609 RepID=A0A2N7PQH2_9BACT|nr:MAG: RNA 3'-phosphate cyclase [Thermodesulfobacterium geofontis]